MKTIIALAALLTVITPVWAEDEPIVLAMKSFEIGPTQSTLRIAPQVGGVPGTPLTAHVQLENGNNLAAEDGTIITLD